MKIEELTREQLIEVVAFRLTESIVDDSADDLRRYVMDLETGKIKPVCTWTVNELLGDLLDDVDCFECEKHLTLENAHADVDDMPDLLLVCETCAS